MMEAVHCSENWNSVGKVGKKVFLRQKLPILPNFEELFALEFSCLNLKDAIILK